MNMPSARYRRDVCNQEKGKNEMQSVKVVWVARRHLGKGITKGLWNNEAFFFFFLPVRHRTGCAPKFGTASSAMVELTR